MILGIDPKVDYAFKRLFGREQNRALLAHLLNAVLKLPRGAEIAELEILNPFNEKEALDDKLSVLDLKARDQCGRLFNIEMQMLAEDYFPQRILYYWAKLYQQQLHEGEDYDDLKPTISICFLNSKLFPAVPDYHLRLQLVNMHHQIVFTDNLALHMIELPKFNRDLEQLVDQLDVWLYFLRKADFLDKDALPSPLNLPIINKAMEELTMISQNPVERERYEARLKSQRDISSSRRAALRAGIKIGSILTFQRLLGRPVSAIEDLEALTQEELNRLADQLQAEVDKK